MVIILNVLVFVMPQISVFQGGKILYPCENNFNILVSHRTLTLLEVLAE